MDEIVTVIWDGWKVTKDAIYSPEGQKFYPSDLRARMYDKALIAEYQKLERIRRSTTNYNKSALIIRFPRPYRTHKN